MTGMVNALFLAAHYMASAPRRTVVLVLGTTVALFLPVFTWLAAAQLEDTMYARAQSSPIVVGHAGNEFDLVISSLYFRGQVRDPITAGDWRRIRQRRDVVAVPLYARYRASGAALVGTNLDYFDQRGLQIEAGRLPGVLGEVVAGSDVAAAFDLSPGDTVRSDLTNLYNIAGSYPIMLEVVGLLAPSGTPDDQAFFGDVKTTWVIDGLFHGHDEVTRASSLNPDREEENLEATAALFMFSEINAQNRSSFHLHGSQDEAPITSVMVFPKDQRAHDQFLGDFALEETLQAVRPVKVIETIFGIVLRLRDAMGVYFAAVAVTTAAFYWLAVTLSLRLRHEELTLMRRLGSSRWAITTIVGAEIGLVLLASVCCTALFVWAGLSLLSAATVG
ncbi:MAG: ABC transporter permease [Myxococcota bacterium]